MGLSMEFYAGSPAAIGKAFTAAELELLRDGSLAHAYADLSLLEAMAATPDGSAGLDAVRAVRLSRSCAEKRGTRVVFGWYL